MNSVVIVPIANLTPNTKDIEIIDEVLFGWPLEIIEEYLKHYKVKTFYNYYGYIKKEYVKILEKPESFPKYIINSSFSDVLLKDKLQEKIFLTLTKGAYVGNSIEETERCLKVNLLNKYGYVRKNFLKEYKKPYFGQKYYKDKKYTEEKIRDNIWNTAYSYFKTGYKWGGKTHLGIDCSGLTFMSYFLNKIIIHRDAKFEKGFGIKKIEKNVLKKSDLIYFQNHIGLYIENDLFIHSSDKNDGVYINSLNDKNLEWELLGFGTIFN
ncbi:MAG: C40 family peptidase [Defluviitaleaceae bacterium]|nr:C40 family peptidase [Defluviitaleaceae bacterium]